MNNSGEVSPHPREHRLALVMNGGVSLAVWMGGVAHEIDNLRRASHGFPLPEGCDPHEAAVLELWGKRSKENKTRVTVDVIGGTSAGGLNGVLLATAIARGIPLTSLRELWITSGQLSVDALLKPQQDGPASVLNGDFFLDRIKQALSNMRPGVADQARDVTLTVTATSLTGSPRVLHDSMGEAFTEADHRRRYEFRRVSGPITYQQAAPGTAATFATQPLRNDFGDDEPIAMAARSSASYPVAFAPVPEKEILKRFRSWPTWSTGPAMEWLADGGILDNSPFDPVLGAVGKQTVSATWQRTVCYVVPSGTEAQLGRELPPPKLADGEILSPPWTAVVSAAFGLPREADFRDDMEELDARIRSGRSALNVGRFQALIEPAAAANLTATVTGADALMPYYRQARAAAAVYEVIDLVNGAPDRDGFLNPVQQVDTAPVISAPQAWLPVSMPAAIPQTWDWGLAAAERLLRLLLRTVRLDDLVLDGVRRALDNAVQRVVAVRQAVAAELPSSAPQKVPWQPTAVEAATLISDVYAALDVPSVLNDLVTSAVTAFCAAVPGGADQLTVLRAALCLEVLDGVSGLPADFRPSPIFDFLRFGISRIPPILATAGSAASAAGILYGTRLHHFAAFVRPAWRKWDYMWGRLHAAIHLGELLELRPGQVEEIITAIIAAEGTTVDAVTAEIGKVLSLGSGELNTVLRSDDIARPAVDAVLALLNSDRRTSPPVPDAVASGGKWISALTARHPGSVGAGRRTVRILVSPLRRFLWSKLRS
jgi:predicted acylesterase/phospholipase RssA